MRHGRCIAGCCIAVGALAISLSTFADIYRSTNKSGHAVFSDIPVENAEKIDLPPAQTYTSPNIPATEESTDDTQPSSANYDAVTLTGVTPESTLQHGLPISVSVSSTPALQGNDRYGVTIDGKPIGEPQTSGQFTIPANTLFRGEHQIQATIIDDKNQILKSSDPIVFYIFQQSIQSPTNPNRNRIRRGN